MSDDKWEKIGEFGVDSGQFWIGDPMFIAETHDFSRDWSKDAEACNYGVIGCAGLGDGGYEVFARFVPVKGYGPRRLAELRVVFITEKDIADAAARYANEE